MRLILKANVDCYCENLLISNKVAVIIPNKYSGVTFHNIVHVEHCAPNQQLQYCHINSTHATYMPLHYVLLFLCGDIDWH